MRIKKIIVPVLIIFVFSLAVSLRADEGKDLKGQFMFGYRSVSTSGALTKYKEDINLDDGMRLFNLSLHYTPSGALKKLVDRIDLRVFNFGGDPFETFSLSAQKYGKFKFQYDRKKSDLLLPGLCMIRAAVPSMTCIPLISRGLWTAALLSIHCRSSLIFI